jgi:hypothetical protein
MTAVLGHLSTLEFGPEYKDWNFPPPERLFGAQVHTITPDVRPLPSRVAGPTLTSIEGHEERRQEH